MIIISLVGDGICFLVNLKLEEGKCLNKDVKKKECLKKYPIDLIEKNHQINVTSDHSVYISNSFKSHFSDKNFSLILTL